LPVGHVPELAALIDWHNVVDDLSQLVAPLARWVLANECSPRLLPLMRPIPLVLLVGSVIEPVRHLKLLAPWVRRLVFGYRRHDYKR